MTYFEFVTVFGVSREYFVQLKYTSFLELPLVQVRILRRIHNQIAVGPVRF